MRSLNIFRSNKFNVARKEIRNSFLRFLIINNSIHGLVLLASGTNSRINDLVKEESEFF